MSPRLEITEHAVLRYIERVYGVDVGRIRAEMMAVPGLAAAAAMGASTYTSGGVIYRLSPLGKVTTVVPAESPQAAIVGASRIRGSGGSTGWTSPPSKTEGRRITRRAG